MKKKIYIFGCVMWDIIGKPSEVIQKGKDCPGFINERPGGVAFNVALGLSKALEKSGFNLSLVSAIGKNDIKIKQNWSLVVINIKVNGRPLPREKL